jgi:hypothetical protein
MSESMSAASAPALRAPMLLGEESIMGFIIAAGRSFAKAI